MSKQKKLQQQSPLRLKKVIHAGRTTELRQRFSHFLTRRPHRSFHRTRRRDYIRSLNLPGYIAFSREVGALLLDHKKLFGKLLVFLVVLFIALDSFNTVQQSYQTYISAADEAEKLGETGHNPFMRAGLVAGGMLTTALTGAVGTTDDLHQVLLGFVLMMAWLITVWLLRSSLSGQMPQLRDGIYNAGAPILSTFMVSVLLLLQLIPLLLITLVITSLNQSGLVGEGFGAMLITLLFITTGVLTLYWIVSTFLALIIITLPGMRPWQAMRAASDIVIGRRIRLMLRILWLAIVVGAAWFLIVGASVLFDEWVTHLWYPFGQVKFVTIIIVVLNNLAIIIVATYIYLLYRKVVADEATPA